MPRFFLHLHDGQVYEKDADGEVYPDLATAKEDAAKFLAEAIEAGLVEARHVPIAYVDITDHTSIVQGVVRPTRLN